MQFAKIPIKIYLDQKDYSRIGKGLSGNHECAKDLEVYHFLMNLVNSDKIRIYFSWCHYIEALRYDEQKIDLLIPYCQVIDSLTKGYCIKWVDELEKSELELFLSRQFGFIPSITNDYPYGKFIDAFSLANDIVSDFQKNFNLDVKMYIKKHLLNFLSESRELFKQFDNHEFIKQVTKQKFGNPSGFDFSEEELIILLFGNPKDQEMLIEKLLDKKEFLKELIKQIPNENLQIIGNSFPGFELSNEELINLLLGDSQTQKDLTRRCLNKSVSFENFVLKYSKLFPQVKKMGDFFKDSSNNINRMIINMQVMYDTYRHLNINFMDGNVLNKSLIHKYVEYFSDDLNDICNKHDLNKEVAKASLLKSRLEEIPSINSILTFCVEYYKRHKGKLDISRKPSQSDIMDLHHIRNLPYVDIYSTDRFFGEVAKRKSMEFDTMVVTSLIELKDVLEKNGIGS